MERTGYVVRLPGGNFVGKRRFDYATGSYRASTSFESADLFNHKSAASQVSKGYRGSEVIPVEIQLKEGTGI